MRIFRQLNRNEIDRNALIWGGIQAQNNIQTRANFEKNLIRFMLISWKSQRPDETQFQSTEETVD